VRKRDHYAPRLYGGLREKQDDLTEHPAFKDTRRGSCNVTAPRVGLTRQVSSPTRRTGNRHRSPLASGRSFVKLCMARRHTRPRTVSTGRSGGAVIVGSPTPCGESSRSLQRAVATTS
jgi:hypothetical protein